MLKNVFFDLDGTIIDCRHRLYRLFQDLVPESQFTFEEYFQIKSRRMDQKAVLQTYFNYSQDKITQFKRDWLAQIETPERLSVDKLVAGLEVAHLKCFSDVDTYIVTNRQYKDRTVQQVKDLGLWDLFTNVLVTEQLSNKAQLIKKYVPSYSSADLIVGDTGEDIQTGKELGIKTVAVESGVLSKEILSEYNPDHIVKSIEVFCENRSLFA